MKNKCKDCKWHEVKEIYTFTSTQSASIERVGVCKNCMISNAVKVSICKYYPPRNNGFSYVDKNNDYCSKFERIENEK